MSEYKLNEITINCHNSIKNFFYDNSTNSVCKVYDLSNNLLGIPYLDIRKKNNDLFDEKFNDLSNCLIEKNNIHILNKFNNIKDTNTIYLEYIHSGRITGLGKIFFKILQNMAKNSNYEYIFLYPSKTLGGTDDQDNLIKYYEYMGFFKLNPCKFNYEKYGLTDVEDDRINIFDANAPYYLMIAKISELNVSGISYSEDSVKYGGNNYYKKYIKYKTKYLSLKNHSIKNL